MARFKSSTYTIKSSRDRSTSLEAPTLAQAKMTARELAGMPLRWKKEEAVYAGGFGVTYYSDGDYYIEQRDPVMSASLREAAASKGSGVFWIAPDYDPKDRYAARYEAGLSANSFATRAEAEAAVKWLRSLDGDWKDVDWVINQDPS